MRVHDNLRKSKPHQHQLHSPGCLATVFTFSGPRCCLPFSTPKGLLSRACSPLHGASTQHSPQWLSTPPYTHLELTATPKGHPPITQGRNSTSLFAFQDPTTLFLFLLPPFPSKTAPRAALFALPCSLPRQGRTARPLAYGNCKVRIVIKV